MGTTMYGIVRPKPPITLLIIGIVPFCGMILLAIYLARSVGVPLKLRKMLYPVLVMAMIYMVIAKVHFFFDSPPIFDALMQVTITATILGLSVCKIEFLKTISLLAGHIKRRTITAMQVTMTLLYVCAFISTFCLVATIGQPSEPLMAMVSLIT
jgi:hypothetical protein